MYTVYRMMAIMNEPFLDRVCMELYEYTLYVHMYDLPCVRALFIITMHIRCIAIRLTVCTVLAIAACVHLNVPKCVCCSPVCSSHTHSMCTCVDVHVRYVYVCILYISVHCMLQV